MHAHRSGAARRELRVLYAAGPGDVVRAHCDWQSGQETSSEVARTFSGQFADFCRENGAKGWIVSSNSRADFLRNEQFIVENRPKPKMGNGALAYHLAQVAYAFSLLASAIRFRAQTVVVDSGTTHWFLLWLFRLFGMRVIAVLHNALWPSGFPERGVVRRLIGVLDGMFWRYGAEAVFCVSPTLQRQVIEAAGGPPAGRVMQMRCQFRPEFFESVAPPPAELVPFRVMFAGRMDVAKGAHDLVKIAAAVERLRPGSVRWEVCGDGPELLPVRQAVEAAGLGSVVQVHGRLNRQEMAGAYSRSHALILPTRGEGLPMVICEAILAGRPVITSRLSNALDVVGDAIVEAEPHSVDSYARGVLALMNDPQLYAAKCRATVGYRAQFVDGRHGFSRLLAVACFHQPRSVSPRCLGEPTG